MHSEYKHSPFEAQLDVVTTIRDDTIKASVEDPTTSLDPLYAAAKGLLDAGVSIDEVSGACGLPPQAIRDRLAIDELESLIRFS